MHHYYPRLLLDVARCRRNIDRMNTKARLHNLHFRPHFKTHQSQTVGQWFREGGIDRITVSSLKMADYFARAGWTDIFVAFPVNLLEMDEIDRLAREIKLSVSIESAFVAEKLAGHLKNNTGVYIKIDTGYHRTGLEPSDLDEIKRILQVIGLSRHLYFKGFYTHSGHTYRASGKPEIERIHADSRAQLSELRNSFLNDFPDLILSVGDTPSCSLVSDFTGLDEIRPGNFVFYDLMQYQLGACSLDDIAVVLECPVVAKNKKRNELLIHGGAVHLSKESIEFHGTEIFGLVVSLEDNESRIPWPDTAVVSLSQEHGIIRTNQAGFDAVQIGDTIGVIPVHSCLTANLAAYFLATSGELISKMRS